MGSDSIVQTYFLPFVAMDEMKSITGGVSTIAAEDSKPHTDAEGENDDESSGGKKDSEADEGEDDDEERGNDNEHDNVDDWRLDINA